MPPDSGLGRVSYASLFERDSCSDAFGETASNSICTPSQTLCCVRRGQVYPSCQQYLNKGWCCVGGNSTDNCYVDQESVCSERNSVPCTDLAEGTTEACCPRLTSCQPGFLATRSLVRCNIQYADLKQAASQSSSSSSSLSSPTTAATTSTFSTSTSQTPTDTASTTPASPNISSTPSPDQASASATPSSGLVAGAAVGGTLAVVAIGILAFIFFRRQRKKRQGLAPQPVVAQTPYADNLYSGYPKPDGGSVVYIPQGQGLGYPPVEIGTDRAVAELDGRGR